MTSTMKFNKKVYVVREEQFLNMMEKCKLRENGDRQGDLRSPAHPSSGKMEAESTRRDGVIEETRGKTHSSEDIGTSSSKMDNKSNEQYKMTKPKTKKNRGTSGTKEILKEALASLSREEAKDNLTKIYTLMMPYKGGRGGKRNFIASLLHTQSDKFPLPKDYKTFYAIVLEKNIPLSLISNTRLRRSLHFLKNKRRKLKIRQSSHSRMQNKNGGSKNNPSSKTVSKRLGRDSGKIKGDKKEDDYSKKVWKTL